MQSEKISIIPKLIECDAQEHLKIIINSKKGDEKLKLIKYLEEIKVINTFQKQIYFNQTF